MTGRQVERPKDSDGGHKSAMEVLDALQIGGVEVPFVPKGGVSAFSDRVWWEEKDADIDRLLAEIAVS